MDTVLSGDSAHINPLNALLKTPKIGLLKQRPREISFHIFCRTQSADAYSV